MMVVVDWVGRGRKVISAVVKVVVAAQFGVVLTPEGWV